MTNSNDSFYQQLPGFQAFSDVAHQHRYRPLPPDWWVAISDVKGSTEAIRNGRYREVNAIGVASIVALLNKVRPLEIPYVFGGDGATACLPASVLEEAKSALRAARALSQQEFGLELRVGLVPVSEIEKAGYQVLVARYQPHPWFGQAMFLGGGLGHAEKLVKDPRPDNPWLLEVGEGGADNCFDGFECRWNEIPSPHGETIALLVQVSEADEQARDQLYDQILARIGEIYGDENHYHPLREEGLKLAKSMGGVAGEAMIRTAFGGMMARIWWMLKARLLVSVGEYLMNKGVTTESTDWGGYKSRLIANSDYRKLDEVLRMVISGTPQQREALRQALEGWRGEGRIVFGIHAAPTALITCVVSDYANNHVHFLDAANGGYALAAKEMKGQMNL
jgi:hypothetical protein